MRMFDISTNGETNGSMPDRLQHDGHGAVETTTTLGGDPNNLRLKPKVEAVERALILQALEATHGNRRAAAGLLGVSLRTLFYKLRRYTLA